MKASAPPAERAANPDYVGSAEALAILAVKPQTLYSYVSRGMVRRICLDGKTSLYSRADIGRLKARSAARSGHGAVAGAALHWGEPVLVTGITEISEAGPRYRQHLASDLVRAGHSYESVAEYLWTAEEQAPDLTWSFDDSILRIAPQVASLAKAHPQIQLHQLLTEIILLSAIDQGEAEDPSSFRTARALVQGLAIAFGFMGPLRRFVAPKEQESLASYLLRSLGVEAEPAQVRVLNAALVLLADHEFSSTTFAARIAASSRVNLHFCVAAALHVQFGSALGLRCDRIEQTLDTTFKLEQPGLMEFNQPVYKDGDPRAVQIIELAMGLADSPAQEMLQALSEDENGWRRAGLDAALVILSHALGLRGLGAGLLAVSRSAGWIAHVLEQYQQDFLIRPRGKFIPGPETADHARRDCELAMARTKVPRRN